jgi:hypothetical protein
LRQRTLHKFIHRRHMQRNGYYRGWLPGNSQEVRYSDGYLRYNDFSDDLRLSLASFFLTSYFPHRLDPR